MAMIRLHGFHGTRVDAVESIREKGLQPSRGDDEWLGAGTYFFMDGLDDPRVSAFEWARCKLWDKSRAAFDPGLVAVIEAVITVEESALFDLREPGNARAFHAVRRRWLARKVPSRSTHLARPAEPTYDTALLNEFKQERGVAGLIGDFYIQFFVRERHFRLDSRIPNVSMLCVTDPLIAGTEVEMGQVEVLAPSSRLTSQEVG